MAAAGGIYDDYYNSASKKPKKDPANWTSINNDIEEEDLVK
jgi:hypothetical protein